MADERRGESEEPIKVMVRLRPENQAERDSGHALCLQAQPGTSALVYNSGAKQEVFTFDHVADVTATQEEVFRTVGKVVADNCLQGYNGTILAYGQTGSGKTYSMQGPFSLTSAHGTSFELRGVIPRTIEYIFAVVNREQKKSGDKVQYLCKCTFIEIYNEKVFDILESVPTQCHLREDIKKGVYIENVTEELVSTPADAFKLLERGVQNRHVAATTMNHESSRSHSIFTLTIQSKTKNGEIITVKESKFNLVDLAGSERQKDTNTSGDRLKEASNINKSLLVLRNVINALVEESNGKRHFIHYRDSKLTFLLKDSLGGNSKTFLIANVSPSSVWQAETLSTLRFAQCVKLIKNRIVLNEDSQADVAALKEHVRRLEAELKAVRERSLHQQAAVSQGIKESALFGLLEKVKRCERERKALCREVIAQREQLDKRDRQVQAEKMVLKFRDSTVASLQKKFTPEALRAYMESENALLRDEIKELRRVIENHPDVVRYAHENMVLQDQLQEYATVLDQSNAGQLYLKVVELEDSAKELGETVARLYGENCVLREDLAAARPDSEEVMSRLGQLKELCDKYRLGYEAEKRKNAELLQKEEKLFFSLEQSKARERELEVELETTKALIAELERAVETTRTNKDLEIRYLQNVVENFKQERDSSPTTDASEVASLRFELGKMEQTLRQKEEEAQQYKQRAAKLEHKARRMTDFASETRTKQENNLTAFTERITRLSDENKQKDAAITDLTGTLEEKEVAIAKAQQQLGVAQAALAAAQREKGDLEMELSGVQQELDRKDEAYAALRDEKQALRDAHQTLLDELQIHTGQAVQDERTIKALTKAKAELEEFISAHMEHIANLEENIRRLSAETSDLTPLVEENAQLREQQRAQVKEREALGQTVQDLQREVAQLRQDAGRREAELLVERNTVTELSVKLKEGREERQQLAESFEDRLEQRLAEVREEHEVAKTKIVEDFATRENRFIQAQRALEQQLHDANAQQAQDKATHSQQVQELRAVIITLTQKVAHDEAEAAGLRKELQSVKSSEEALAKQLGLRKERVQQLEAQVTDLQAAQQELTALLAKNDQSENVDQLLKRNEHLEKQLEKEQAKTHGYKEQQYQLSKLIEDLEAGRKQKNDQIASLKAEVTALRQEQASIAGLHAQVKELEGARQRLAVLERAAEEHEQERQRLGRDQDLLRKESDANAAAVKQLEFSLKAAALDNEDLLAKMDGLKEMEEEAHNEARKYESQYKQVQEEMLRLQEEKAKLRAEAKKLADENEKLIQHANTKQKLQYHVKIKQENNALREEIMNLKRHLSKAGGAVVAEAKAGKEKENSTANAGSSTTSTPDKEAPAHVERELRPVRELRSSTAAKTQ